MKALVGLRHAGSPFSISPCGVVGGNVDGATSVEVSGVLGCKVLPRDERTPDTFEALRREAFLLRGCTLADFINKTKTEEWMALVEILGLDAIERLRKEQQRADASDLRAKVPTRPTAGS